MRFLLPLASACLLATSSGQAQAQSDSSASKPKSDPVTGKPITNRPASFFLEEITTKPAVTPAKSATKPAAGKSAAKPTGKTAAKSATPATPGKSNLQEKISKQKPLSSHFQQGLVMQSMGMNDYAIVEYRDALKEDPKFISTYNNLAQCLINRGKDEDKAEALSLLNEATKIDPNNMGTLHALALLKEQNKDEAGAQEIYNKILAVQPLNMRAIQNLSEMYFRLGQKDKAKAVVESALKQNPPDQQRVIFEEALKNLNKPAPAKTASKDTNPDR
jgi:tetratricopeptide (TPR) repeat protein